MSLRLSVIIAAFNEERTLASIVERVRSVPLNTQIVVVNDGSRDRTGAVLDRLAAEGAVDVPVHHPQNRGKGAAIRTGIEHATGDVIVVAGLLLAGDGDHSPVARYDLMYRSLCGPVEPEPGIVP